MPLTPLYHSYMRVCHPYIIAFQPTSAALPGIVDNFFIPPTRQLLNAPVFCPDCGQGFNKIVGKRRCPERQFYSLGN